MLISIVGKSGSGKSTIARLLTEYNENIIHLDIDKISHQVIELEQVKEKLIKAFGLKIIHDNKINRKVLGSIVFTDEDEMDKLTEITWPVMEKQIDEYIMTNKDKIIILDYQLLPKTKYFEISNLRILVTASQDTRKQRIIKRDNITTQKFIEREKASLDTKDIYFDYVIRTENKEVEEEVKKIYEKSIVSR